MENQVTDLGEAILKVLREEKVFSDIRVVQDQPMVIKTPAGWRRVGEAVELDALKVFLNNIEDNWEDRLARSGRAIDSSMFMEDTRVRCTTFFAQARHNLCMVIRMLPEEPTPLNQTGLPVFVEGFTAQRSGLVLVAGPTGSGKTSSLASMLQKINETRAAHVVTIEEPIEYLFEDKQAFFTQREVGQDVDSFAFGMEEAMRQCPDVIMVGEIRDVDTALACFRASDSGHLVFATIHANTAAGAIMKLLSFFGENGAAKSAALAQSLVGVIAQRLVRSTAGQDGAVKFVLAAEVLNGKDPQVIHTVTSGDFKTLDEQLYKNSLSNCVSFNASLMNLVRNKQIEMATAKAASPQPEGLR